ncbi:Fic family protein [Streptomyces sp. NPDC002054]|uniref:Fic family protein n=1 Tax=Streptomyces sp. NPDC002054 TaxID=3154663 RepID=UPI0033311E23
MLMKTPRLDSEDTRVLDEIDSMRHELRHMLQPTRRWMGQLRRNFTARAIAGSNTIEGYVATAADVEAVMAGEEPPEASEATRRELEGYRHAMTYIQSLSEAAPGFRYDLGLLNGLHFMIQEHHHGKSPGIVRSTPVHVTSAEDPEVPAYTAPEPEAVPALMEEFVQWLNEGDLDAPVHVRASMAHLNLVKIHPWRDGNGRMSRALSTLVFSREALVPPEFSSIEEWLGRTRNTFEYYDVLAQTGGRDWSPGADTREWIRFCLRAHHLQAQAAKRRLDRSNRGWIALAEAVAAAPGLDERMVYALFTAFNGTPVRRSVYQEDADVNRQMAIRDMRKLVQQGWLVAHGETRGRFYTAGPALSSVIADVVRTPGPYEEPYGRARWHIS